MNTKLINRISASLILLMILFLYGCGASSPTGNGGPGRQSQTTVPIFTSGNALNVTVSFPIKSTTGPAALISASTSYFEIWVRQDAGAFLGPIIGYAKVTSPVGGGSTSVKVDLNPYAGLATVEVWGYNQNGNGNSFMWNNTTILAANNPPLSIVVVEMGQGINMPAGHNLVSPDGTSYPITKIFLDTNNRVGVQGAYEMGIQVNIPASASAGIFASSRSSIPGGTPAPYAGGFWSDGTTNNPLQLQWDIVNGMPDFNIDVPNAAKNKWNRYYIKLNFQPGGVPTNNPTVQATFVNTYMLDAAGAASVTAGIQPAAPGTMVLNIPNATWSNNVAPAPNTQGIVLF